MKRILFLTAAPALALWLAGCQTKAASDPAAGAPPAAQVEQEGNADFVKVPHPEKFPLVAAGRRDSSPTLETTGVVSADVSRNVPVISIATGRILEVKARLGDTVTKGQLLLRVQSADISGAFSDYRQAVADAKLARTQLERSKILYEKGAIAQKDLEVAEDVDAKAKVTVETTIEHLRVLGVDKDRPTAIVDVFSPASGVITDQQVTSASGTQGVGLTERVYDLRFIACVDRLRRVRKRHVLRSARCIRRDPPERISGPGTESPRQQHQPDHGPQSANGQGPA